MSSFDLETLLLPVSADQPSGPDLEYDPDNAELAQAVKGKPEQQFGDTVIEAEEPDWKSVRKLAVGLLGRTKDLRIAVHLANASLALGSFADFRDVLALVEGYLVKFWDDVHPALDPDDDDDPTERINAVAALQDTATTVRFLHRVPLLRVSGVQPISLLDIQIARGDVQLSEGQEVAFTTASIEGAFQNCNLQQLKELLETAEQSRRSLGVIESAITAKVGASRAVGLDRLLGGIKEIEVFVRGQLGKRQDTSVEPAGPADLSESDVGTATAGSPAVVVATGDIRNRDDVIQAIDRICQYYEKYEPSSPLPLLLGRARRLVTASFMQIIEDLTPDALQQAEQIGGGRSGG